MYSSQIAFTASLLKNFSQLSPVSFAKKPGTHTITLRKTGYVTRSYTIEIDSEEKDVTYSFADLLESDSATKKSTDEETTENETETASTNLDGLEDEQMNVKSIMKDYFGK